MPRAPLTALFLALCACSTVHVLPTDPNVYRVGRFQAEDHFVWSGTRFSLRFTGTSVAAHLIQRTRPESAEGPGQPVRFRIDLDGTHYELFAEADDLIDFVQRDLVPGDHHLLVIRESEALVGEAQLLGFDLDPGARVLEWDRPASRRLEFIGDSTTVGYGVEGHEPCRYSSSTQTITAAFPYLVSVALNADFTVVAWSGRGITRNYDDRAEPLLPELWTPAATAPDVVLLSLGSNDFWNGDPGEEKFVTAYRAFIARIRAAYPKAYVYAVTGWSTSEERRTRLRRYLEQTDAKVIELGAPTGEEGRGCAGHASPKTHRRAADEIIARLRADQSG